MIVVTKDKAEKFDGKKPGKASKEENDISLEAESVDEKSDEKKSSKKREK